MEPNSQILLLPYEEASERPTKDVLKPTILVLAGQCVVSETVPATPLYQLNWNVTSIPQRGSSVVFERVKHGPAEPASSTAPSKQPKIRHLFYLAHPAGAKFGNEKPAYYLTSVLTEVLGNISLEASKSQFQKPEFRALLSPEKTMSAVPLFDGKAQLLFDVRPKWLGGRYTWTN